jgi:hypothetical protein
MAKLIDSRVHTAHEALSANVLAILKVREMKRVKLARAVEADGGPVSKTTYNILAKRHPPNLDNWAFIAKALDVPLWVLLIPGLDQHADLIKNDGLKRLAKLVDNYMTCDDQRRGEAEVVAQAGAIMKKSAGRS